MYVEVRDGRVFVGEPDDCASLEIRVAPSARGDVDAVLEIAGLGTYGGGDQAALSVAALRALAAPGAATPDWAERWDAMIAYAGRKGWLLEDGTLVAAHLVDLD